MEISDTSPLSNPAIDPLPEPAAPSDVFASGRENRLRRWVARIAGFLFKPPHLPWPLVLFCSLWTLVTPLNRLMLLGQEYWAGGTTNFEKGLYNDLLNTGPLAVLAFFLFQALVIGLLMLLLNRKAAFVLLIYIVVDFMGTFTWTFLYFAHFIAEMENWVFIGFLRLLVLSASALTWGLAFAGGMKMLLASQDADAPPVRVPFSIKAALGLLVAYLLTAGMITIQHAAEPRATWRQVQTAHAPTGRYSVNLAYDTLRGQAVLFGGAEHWDMNASWIGSDDTWVWDGSDWIEQHPAQRPPARLDAALAYDEKRDVVVLFGGQNRKEALNDTWEWDGAQWTQRTPEVSPQPRCCAELVYDPTRQQVVLFSGYAPDRTPPAMENVFYYDAWAWDGQNWHEITLDSRRYASYYAVMPNPFQPGSLFIYDPQGRWTWQEDRIRPIDAGQSPPGRYNVGLAYDPNMGEIIAFGGRLHEKNFDETWRYDGTEWRRLYTEETPPIREYQGMFYDQKRGRVVLFGGYDGKNFFNDTWELIVP